MVSAGTGYGLNKTYRLWLIDKVGVWPN